MEKLALLEAILFTTSEPLEFKELKKLTGLYKVDLEKALKELEKRYEDPAHGIKLSDIGGYKLVVKSEFMQNVTNLTPHADMSRGLLRVLSIIAYHEPVRQSEIVKVIGNRTYDYVKELHERGLVKSEKRARSKILSTTPKFEEYFETKKEDLKKGKSEKMIEQELEQKEEVKEGKPIKEDTSDGTSGGSE